MLLEADKLDIHYGTNHAVREVSLHIDQGEIVTVLGANGAGKSSLLRGIMGAVPATGGTIRFHGADISAKKCGSKGPLRPDAGARRPSDFR